MGAQHILPAEQYWSTCIVTSDCEHELFAVGKQIFDEPWWFGFPPLRYDRIVPEPPSAAEIVIGIQLATGREDDVAACITIDPDCFPAAAELQRAGKCSSRRAAQQPGGSKQQG